MVFLIGLFTLIMVLDCLVLILLVLIQLPKKDAGAGLAFGGGATDALFGAGSGNVLTRITKYSAGAFFVLAIMLALMQKSYHSHDTTAFVNGGVKSSQSAPFAPPTATPSQPLPTVSSNTLVSPPSLPLLTGTNALVKPTVEAPMPTATTTNGVPAPAAPK